MHVDILIIGAGPTGLGAAWRLHERGHRDWLLIEKTGEAGGLAGSVRDERGYVWDQGGHVQFSHYETFDRVMDELIPPEEWLYHERESWVWLHGRFVPYPFQNNLRYLPREAMWDCVRGLIRASREMYREPPENFGEWARRSFGEGICRHFMEPYNRKVWAYPLEDLAWGWIGDRVAVVDLERVLENIIFERDDVSWGPNNQFRFPLNGGTGEIWRRCAARLPTERMRLHTPLIHLKTTQRRAVVEIEGRAEEIEYGSVISSIPLDALISISDLAGEDSCAEAARTLRHSSTHIIGLGIAGDPPSRISTKCWMYFPESNCPFYRVTVFSNYSPRNVPDITKGWSLMCEVSESPVKPVNGSRVVEETVQGVLATGLVSRFEEIIHRWYRRLPYGYPTPTVERDAALAVLYPKLEGLGIFSRGRFGAWKYEVSNQDHSFMQGHECVDRILDGAEEVTLNRPGVVNAARPRSLPVRAS